MKDTDLMLVIGYHSGYGKTALLIKTIRESKKELLTICFKCNMYFRIDKTDISFKCGKCRMVI